ncbi:DUF5808 domain-containing protein [uncultured Sphingomonas sp.]|uniref:DUF5808 domain-containing protein n=1 Tax=uncultured Sphingomonas sp. TaxID=158754 RepID=UPI0025CD810D|nr:DUF5808 domain-containing protein [uncultured Sphingomonas sp.]
MMPKPGKQDVALEAIWSNPAHWAEGTFGCYFAKEDPRLWVPRRKPGRGRTLNMAHPQAGKQILGSMLFCAFFPVAVLVFTRILGNA